MEFIEYYCKIESTKQDYDSCDYVAILLLSIPEELREYRKAVQQDSEYYSTIEAQVKHFGNLLYNIAMLHNVLTNDLNYSIMYNTNRNVNVWAGLKKSCITVVRDDYIKSKNIDLFVSNAGEILEFCINNFTIQNIASIAMKKSIDVMKERGIL